MLYVFNVNSFLTFQLRLKVYLKLFYEDFLPAKLFTEACFLAIANRHLTLGRRCLSWGILFCIDRAPLATCNSTWLLDGRYLCHCRSQLSWLVNNLILPDLLLPHFGLLFQLLLMLFIGLFQSEFQLWSFLFKLLLPFVDFFLPCSFHNSPSLFNLFISMHFHLCPELV
jgi:hypothetical protein